MKTRILLINFNSNEQETISKLGVDVDLGYLSNPFEAVAHDGSNVPEAFFYSPSAIYEYKAIFIRLTKNPPLENELKGKSILLGKNDVKTFFNYWHSQKGELVIFTEESDYKSLILLGITQAELTKSRGNDKTIFFSLDTKNRPFREMLKSLKSLITIPPCKYIEVQQNESREYRNSWTIYSVFENRNDETLGIYFNWGNGYSDEDEPAYLILPAFKNYSDIIIKLLKAFARIYPKFFSEISELDWPKSDNYYPKEVVLVEKELKQLVEETKSKVNALNIKKNKLKEQYSYLHDLLIETGDRLKESVIKTLTEIFKLQAEDADKSKKKDFAEDIVINAPSVQTILAEVKGTKNPNPSFTYVSQVFSNLLKGKEKFPDAIGCLILNHDRFKEPTARSVVYTKSGEEKQIAEIIYIDTRALFNLALAVIDYKMPITEARKILLQKGRIIFNLTMYIKQIEGKT